MKNLDQNERLVIYWKILNYDHLRANMEPHEAHDMAAEADYFPIDATRCVIHTPDGGYFVLIANGAAITSVVEGGYFE